MIQNRLARRVFMQRHGLLDPPGRKLGKAGLLEAIDRLGFVQVDSINTVERAHHMILLGRSQTYQPRHLKALVEKDRALFEHWTHDAAIIPTSFYPYWQRHFARTTERLRGRWQRWHGDDFDAQAEGVLEHIARHGPVLARELNEPHPDRPRRQGWWAWHPSKKALEYLWRTGRLAVCRRDGFQKVYDLVERVIPEAHRHDGIDEAALVDWACRAALDRLGFATSGEIAAFWGIVTPAEARTWCAAAAHGAVITSIESADGSAPRKVLADAALLDLHSDDLAPPPRIRVLSPFDPLVRDRDRALRLFDFDYRIEVFVPEAKRRWGYYVFPLLEGDRFVGRIDMRAERGTGTLAVRRLWWEPGIRATRGRLGRLEAELARVARFAGCDRVRFDEHPGAS
ncbi:MAG: crosslink repair DNA glycosylase YcaQ family protein [Geminicoccaceae bacterium]